MHKLLMCTLLLYPLFLISYERTQFIIDSHALLAFSYPHLLRKQLQLLQYRTGIILVGSS
jgi:hypothetical protein